MEEKKKSFSKKRARSQPVRYPRVDPEIDIVLSRHKTTTTHKKKRQKVKQTSKRQGKLINGHPLRVWDDYFVDDAKQIAYQLCFDPEEKHKLKLVQVASGPKQIALLIQREDVDCQGRDRWTKLAQHEALFSLTKDFEKVKLFALDGGWMRTSRYCVARGIPAPNIWLAQYCTADLKKMKQTQQGLPQLQNINLGKKKMSVKEFILTCPETGFTHLMLDFNGSLEGNTSKDTNMGRDLDLLFQKKDFLAKKEIFLELTWTSQWVCLEHPFSEYAKKQMARRRCCDQLKRGINLIMKSVKNSHRYDLDEIIEWETYGKFNTMHYAVVHLKRKRTVV
jgi:hypothetical protein